MWYHDAACAGHDPSLWDGVPQTRSSYSGLDFTEARKICMSCPVQRECLLDALQTDSMGTMRAGKDPRELKKHRDHVRRSWLLGIPA